MAVGCVVGGSVRVRVRVGEGESMEEVGVKAVRNQEEEFESMVLWPWNSHELLGP